MKCQAASEEGDFSVIYRGGTMTEQLKKKDFVKGVAPSLWWD